MTKVKEETLKLIEETEARLAALREEFDRVDANHPHRSFEIQTDIRDCISNLESLRAMVKWVR